MSQKARPTMDITRTNGAKPEDLFRRVAADTP